MNIDKKSILQITILVVLVGGAGAYYLTTQEGGLGFIADLLPGEEKTAKPAPAPTVAPVPKPDTPPIPAHPAKGQVAGKPFEPEAVVLEGGELAFVQSKEPQTAIRIRLVASKWETPGGKKFKYAPAGANAAMVTVNRMEAGAMKQQVFSDKYTLVLEFGQEKDRKLPGKLSLALADEAKTMLEGTFEAEIKGFRIVDGKPDLTADSTETLEYLALKELLKDDPDKKLEVIALRDGRYSADATGKDRVGYLEVEYRLGQGNAEIKRFQFAKDPEWKVRGALALNEVDEAHPVAAPGPKDAPERVLPYLAAKRLEADVKKKSPKKGLYGASFITRANAKNKIGVVEVSYRLEPNGQPTKTAYLIRLKQNGWALERELKAKEKVNVETGKIEIR